jgi:GGDEF domain-containing protein
MIAMLTETVADLSGQTDVSVARLQAIEKQVELASELNDIRTLKTQLGDSLHALREAAAQQRSSSAATVARLRGQIAKSRQPTSDHPKEPPKTPVDDAAAGLMPEPSDDPAEPVPTSYVAAFKLQRADHIASRFGEAAKTQMLSLIAAKLKTVLGPSDRLLRWKGTSFVMFIDSPETIQDVRVRLAGVVAETSQQYIEVGRKSTLLSVGVDWIVFPQSGRANLDVVFAEVDSFLANTRQVPAQAAALR